MNPASRLFSRKMLIRSLLVSVAILVIYFSIAATLIFWPSPEPFADAKYAIDEQAASEMAVNSDGRAATDVELITIETRDQETIFARRYGSEATTTIILLHGIAADSTAMSNAARLLQEATAAEVLTPDFRGHGQSGGPPFDNDYIGQYEDDLEDIVGFVGRERPGNRIVVAGHSMGGGVAMRYALKDDAPVPNAYLLFAPNFGEGPTQRSGDDAGDTSSFVHFDVRRMIGIIMLNSVGIHALDDLPILYFNGPSLRMDYSYRAVLSAQPIRPNTSDIALQAISSPLLVIVGANDEVFEVAQFEPFISANSDGETVILPGLTHDGIVNDPATYEVAAEWYTRLP